MIVVGLTGGIGSGKSTFAALLAERGVQIIDADLLGREALLPGRPAWHSVVDQFGDDILVEGTMDIDRGKLADVVFSDRNKLAALNAIVHPVILRGIADRLDRLRTTDAIVVVDAALLVELGIAGDLDATIVVVADKGARRDRLVRERGLRPRDIDARMASQTSDEDRIAAADVVVTNDGTLEDLAKEAERVWERLQKLPHK